MNPIRNLTLFINRKIEPGFKIDKDALVIDIGSGDKPFWRADVYLDKLSLGNVQRASKSDTIHDLGQFVDSDVTKMPFKDKAFDFSFCSHLLEHVDDPKKAIEEIVRISKKGYLEMPNGILESIQPFDSHLWFVFQDKNKLIFFRKGKKLHAILNKNGMKYKSLLSKVYPPFIRLYWKNNILFEIIDDNSKNEKFTSLIRTSDKSCKKFNLYLTLVKILRGIFYKNKGDVLRSTLR
jgi:ubiquinone/menaquinone biosynthesis C-methylase UbiE